MRAKTGYKRTPRRQSAVLRVAEVSPVKSEKIKAPRKPFKHKGSYKGTITLIVKGRPILRKNYKCRPERAEIIARWLEEFDGVIEYVIKPNENTITH